MKLLVCGAGIQGSFLAIHLHRQGCDVSLLARGTKVQTYTSDGIQIVYHPSTEVETHYVPVVSEIDQNEGYDLFMVAMQKQQSALFSSTLGDVIGDGTVLFLGNNATGIADYQDNIDPAQILIGFLGIGGFREAPHMTVAAGDPVTIWLGMESDTAHDRLNQVTSFLKNTGFFPIQPESIDGWLKCHLALILPMAGAVYGANIDNLRLSRTPGLLKLMNRGLKDTFSVMRRLGIKIDPWKINLYTRLPDWLFVRLFRGKLAERATKISLSGHAAAARNEMQHLATEFQQLIDRSGAKTPYYDRLRQFIDDDSLVIEEGLTAMPL